MSPDTIQYFFIVDPVTTFVILTFQKNFLISIKISGNLPAFQITFYSCPDDRYSSFIFSGRNRNSDYLCRIPCQNMSTDQSGLCGSCTGSMKNIIKGKRMFFFKILYFPVCFYIGCCCCSFIACAPFISIYIVRLSSCFLNGFHGFFHCRSNLCFRTGDNFGS